LALRGGLLPVSGGLQVIEPRRAGAAGTGCYNRSFRTRPPPLTMGIDINAAQLLMRARRSGVSFDSFVSFGRQTLYARKDILLSLLREQKWDVTDEQRDSLLAPSGSTADEFLRILGAKEILAVDASDYEGAAIVHDMNTPIDARHAGRFDAVFDGGTLEHVFNFPVGIANAMRLVRTGGHYLAATPANNFFGHGFYQFSAELYYRIFSEENGFRIESMVVWEESSGSPYYEISDPAAVRSRVEFVSRRPTYLFIQARKIADVPPFRTYPQQSDYTAVWNDSAAGAKPREAVLPDSWPFRIREAARRRGLSKLVGRLPMARRLHSWSFRIGQLRENVRGYWKPIPGIEVQRFTSTKWLN
jgi:hypothetical protein